MMYRRDVLEKFKALGNATAHGSDELKRCIADG
jgi:hypothetical protein